LSVSIYSLFKLYFWDVLWFSHGLKYFEWVKCWELRGFCQKNLNKRKHLADAFSVSKITQNYVSLSCEFHNPEGFCCRFSQMVPTIIAQSSFLCTWAFARPSVFPDVLITLTKFLNMENSLKWMEELQTILDFLRFIMAIPLRRFPILNLKRIVNCHPFILNLLTNYLNFQQQGEKQSQKSF
jgi:hypothetical protein